METEMKSFVFYSSWRSYFKLMEDPVLVTELLNAILDLAGIDDAPTFKRSKIINMAEDTQMVLLAAQYLDAETVLKHLPFVNHDEVDEILKRMDAEEIGRYADETGQGEAEDGQAS